MAESLVEKLLDSFEQLDKCITVTKTILSSRPGVPEDVIQRVSQYSEIVRKQRETAEDLHALIAKQDWEEVGRRVKIINSLSAMIRDDAQAILEAAEGSNVPVPSEQVM